MAHRWLPLLLMAASATALLNECLLGTHNCHEVAQCTDTLGSFTCSCPAPYEGDGVTCTSGDGCMLNCLLRTCIDPLGLGLFQCSCPAGYAYDGLLFCNDINECTAGAHNCAAGAATCTNTAGSFACACNAGYEGNGTVCADIDECLSAPCQNGGTCQNQADSFACLCPANSSGPLCAGGPACPAVVQDGVAYPQTMAGASITASCPAGGTLTRACSPAGAWLAPNVNGCYASGWSLLGVLNAATATLQQAATVVVETLALTSVLGQFRGLADVNATAAAATAALQVLAAQPPLGANVSLLADLASALGNMLDSPAHPPVPQGLLPPLTLLAEQLARAVGNASGPVEPLPLVASNLQVYATQVVGGGAFDVGLVGSLVRVVGSALQALLTLTLSILVVPNPFHSQRTVLNHVLDVTLRTSEGVQVPLSGTIWLTFPANMSAATYEQAVQHLQALGQENVTAVELVANQSALAFTSAAGVGWLPVGLTCAWWDFDLDDWSTEGCELETATSEGLVCRCSHMTHFGVLMDLDAVRNASSSSLSETDELALQVLMYFGTGLSLVLLGSVVFCYAVAWAKINKPYLRILVHLCVSLIGMQLTFALGMDRGDRGDVACQATGMLLHFFVLTTFAWTLAESINMYLTFVRILPQQRDRSQDFLVRASVVFWVVPAVVVATTGLAVPGGYQSPEYCWISDPAIFFAALLGPLVLLALINTVVLVTVMRVIRSHSQNNAKRVTKMLLLRAAVIFFFLLGLHWVFGLLIVVHPHPALYYLFTITMTLQSLLVFYRALWRHETIMPILRKRLARFTRLNTSNLSSSKTPPTPRSTIQTTHPGTPSGGSRGPRHSSRTGSEAGSHSPLVSKQSRISVSSSRQPLRSNSCSSLGSEFSLGVKRPALTAVYEQQNAYRTRARQPGARAGAMQYALPALDEVAPDLERGLSMASIFSAPAVEVTDTDAPSPAPLVRVGSKSRQNPLYQIPFDSTASECDDNSPRSPPPNFFVNNNNNIVERRLGDQNV